jgi:hypothetical protein
VGAALRTGIGDHLLSRCALDPDEPGRQVPQ